LRHSLAVAIFALALAIVFSSVSTNAETDSKNLKVERIELIDSKGDLRGIIGALPNGPAGIVLYSGNRDGAQIGIMADRDNSGTLMMRNADGHTALFAGHDLEGGVGIRLQATKKSPRLSVTSEGGGAAAFKYEGPRNMIEIGAAAGKPTGFRAGPVGGKGGSVFLGHIDALPTGAEGPTGPNLIFLKPDGGMLLRLPKAKD